MDLIAWLEDLASAYRIEPSEMTTRRYLKSLERWHLNPEQWELFRSCCPSVREISEHRGTA